MDFVEGPYSYGAPSFCTTDEQSVQEAIERIEPFLKGQGYLPLGGSLRVLNATAEEAYLVLDLIFRLASQQQQDDRSREQLRDQADKDRVALAHAQKKNEALEETNRRLLTQMKELESKLLTAKHKAEEQERDLKQKLQSTTVRLNGYLYGGRDAGKRTVAGNGCGGGANPTAATGSLRRSAPAYDRFRDDPVEAAEAMQKLEAELSQLRQQNMRLKKQLAASRDQLGASPRMVSLEDSPVRDGQRVDQLPTVPEGGALGSVAESQSNGRTSLDIQVVRSSLNDLGEVARLQRVVKELQVNMEQQQRQLEKGAADRSELHKTLSSLRSKCASLEVERKNAEDRFLRAQRATAALLEPAVSEAQIADLRAKLEIVERHLFEANNRADGLQQRLAAAEVELESNHRHVGVLKRAIRALPRGQEALEQLEQLVSEELQPLRDQLRNVKAELEVIRAQSAARNYEFLSANGTLGPNPSSSSYQSVRQTSDGLPLSPAMPLPSSPIARFDGFRTRPGMAADSPPLVMQPPPMHAYYNRAYSSTMPSERMTNYTEINVIDNLSPRTQVGELPGPEGNTANTQPSAGVVVGTSCGASIRRSMSAGVTHRASDAYTSADRQRARWQVNNPHTRQRFPSPIDILMEQARNLTVADATISITASPVRDAHSEVSSQDSTPRM